MRVKFFPKNYLITEVCNHKHNAEMTFSEATDVSYLVSSTLMEMWGFQYSIRLGVFSSQYNGDSVNLTEVEKTGLLDFDIYFQTDFWRNPLTNEVGYITDFGSEVWTQDGVDVYGTVVLGEPKDLSYPNQGQEMYDLTNGALGYDYINSVSGASNQSELIGIVESQQNWYYSLFNKYTSSLSYRVGRDNSAISGMAYWLSGRNSLAGENGLLPQPEEQVDTFYGVGLGYDPTNATDVDRGRLMSYKCSFRYLDYAEAYDIGQADTFIQREIPSTISNNGWFRDFTHWHNASNDYNVLKNYLAECRSLFGSSQVHCCSNGEAVEYLFLREIVNRVSAQEKDGKVYVVADVIDYFKNQNHSGINGVLSLNEINSSLSVKVDLTGTSLAGKNVVSNFGKLIDLGANVVVVEIPFSFKELFIGVMISEGNNGYYDTTVPTATNSTENDVLTITSNMNTKAVLFSVVSGGAEIDYRVDQRSNEFKEEHIFNVTSGMDYRVGIISEFGQANLIDI